MKVIDFHDANCKHCYKCVRNCRVKAISVKNEQAHIVREACIHCGYTLAKEKNIQELHAEIYSFNTQSQRMFQSLGFEKVDEEHYILNI